MNTKPAFVALMLGQALVAANVSAACVAGNIAGTWYTHAAFFDYTGASGGDWVRCKLLVNSAGGVSTTASQCRLSSGTSLTVSTGTLRVSTGCVVSGSVTTARNGAAFLRMAVQYGQMDASHRSFSALGYDSARAQWKFMLQAVQQ
ncbi:MAG: hypothetical protein HZB57_01355 [Gammaproteobacteria bacterium]|nr:hypothetical protein [Gammaproteobacteria bacterium]